MLGREDAPATGTRVLDPAERVEHARGLAWRALARRERTESELRRTLEGKRVEPELAEQIVGELRDDGYLDDAGYARRFAEDRRRLDGWGAERIERKLRSLGVPGEHIAAAVAGRDEGEELEAAVALLARRFPQPPESARERDRALGVLVRRGYRLEVAHDALRRYAGVLAD